MYSVTADLYILGKKVLYTNNYRIQRFAVHVCFDMLMPQRPLESQSLSTRLTRTRGRRTKFDTCISFNCAHGSLRSFLLTKSGF